MTMTTTALNKDETKWNPAQFHWHVPSEHSVDGKLQSAEIHFVHESAAGGLAVLGIMFKLDESANAADSPFVKSLIAARASALEGEDKKIDLTFLNGWTDSKKIWRYAGSLTTPPCTEGLTWTVIQDVQPITKTSLDILNAGNKASSKATNGNNRVVQPLNDRKLYFTVDPEGDKNTDGTKKNGAVTTAMAMGTAVAALSLLAF